MEESGGLQKKEEFLVLLIVTALPKKTVVRWAVLNWTLEIPRDATSNLLYFLFFAKARHNIPITT